MHSRFEKSDLTAIMKMESGVLMQWVQGTGCLLKPGFLYFYEENNLYWEFEFALDGCNLPGAMVVEGYELSVKNAAG